MQEDIPINIENNKNGKELKEAYLAKVGKPGANIRLFCIGQEIGDTVQLHKYSLANDFVMICHFVL